MIIYTAGSVVLKKYLVVKMVSLRLSVNLLRPSFVGSEGALKWSCEVEADYLLTAVWLSCVPAQSAI